MAVGSSKQTFRRRFFAVREVSLLGPSGVLESPMYPREDFLIGSFSWTIRVPGESYVRISWDSVNLYPEECRSSYIQVCYRNALRP